MLELCCLGKVTRFPCCQQFATSCIQLFLQLLTLHQLIFFSNPHLLQMIQLRLKNLDLRVNLFLSCLGFGIVFFVREGRLFYLLRKKIPFYLPNYFWLALLFKTEPAARLVNEVYALIRLLSV